MCAVMEELKLETLIEAIKNLKVTQHWTNEQALTALNIDKSKWPRIIALLSYLHPTPHTVGRFFIA